MPIVVDANLIAAAANREPAGTRVIDRIGVLEIAEALGRRRTGDAVYLALAEELAGRLVTLDGSLARAGAGAGSPVEALR